LSDRLTKFKGGHKVGDKIPSRYHTFDNPYAGKNSSESRSNIWIEFFPQNCWQFIGRNTLTIKGWNHKSDLNHLEDRIQQNDFDSSWIGIKDRDDLNKLLRVGDLSKDIKLTPKFSHALKNLSQPQKKRLKKWINNEDGEIMAEAVRCLDPEIFYAKRKTYGKKHRTNLIIPAGGNSNISEFTIKTRARIYARIIDEMQKQGHNVGVYCIDPIGNHNNYNMHYIIWEVKRHDEQMTITQLQRDLGHPAIYRTAVFDIIASAPKCPGGGLGYTATDIFTDSDGYWARNRRTLKEAIQIEIGEPSIILNLLPLENNIKKEKLGDILNKVSNSFKNLTTNPKTSGIHIINQNDER
tara:strand:+ start:4621 stop:5676 length:1056 start_codon:yes stop_codon:yes gene_type:complete